MYVLPDTGHATRRHIYTYFLLLFIWFLRCIYSAGNRHVALYLGQGNFISEAFFKHKYLREQSKKHGHRSLTQSQMNGNKWKVLETLLLTAMWPPLPKASSLLSRCHRPYTGEAAIILLSASLRQKENHGEIISKLCGTNRYNPKNLHHMQRILQIG